MRKLALIALAATAALALAPSAGATFPGTNGVVLFQSSRTGDSELYVQNLDGSKLRKLVSRPGLNEYNPNWNPSGKRLVFQSGPPDNSDFDLYLVNANGSGLTPLLVGATYDYRAQFCDEDTIVFERVTDGNSDVYAIETNGTGLRRLTDDPANDSAPTCSPDGAKVAFVSTRAGVQGIYEVALASAAPARGPALPARLPQLAGAKLLVAFAVDPEYSPTGEEIAYAAGDPMDRNIEIFTKNLTTGAVTQRTFSPPPIVNRLPKYLPDQRIRSLRQLAGQPGTTLLFTEDSDGTDAGRSVDSTADEFEEIDPGSAAVVQPVVTGRCRCDFLDVKLENLRLTYQELADRSVRARLTFRIDSFLACTQGLRGKCTARVHVSANRGFGGLGSSLTCRGKCQRRSEGTATTQRDIRVQMDSAESRPDLANRVIAIDLRTTCSGLSALTRYNVSIGPSGRVTNVTEAHVG